MVLCYRNNGLNMLMNTKTCGNRKMMVDNRTFQILITVLLQVMLMTDDNLISRIVTSSAGERGN